MMKGQKGYVLVQKLSFRGFCWRTVLQTVARWHRQSCERAELASMSDEALKDIGLSRADVEREISRPFWGDPMSK